MTNYLYGLDNWKKYYSSVSSEERRKTWIFIHNDKDEEIYLKDYKDWLTMQDYVDSTNTKITKIGLRYKTNSITLDTAETDGVYLSKSLKGEFGGITRKCFTIGTVKGDKVDKSMWITPELIEEDSYEDKIENCFEEAIVYHGKRKE